MCSPAETWLTVYRRLRVDAPQIKKWCEALFLFLTLTLTMGRANMHPEAFDMVRSTLSYLRVAPEGF